MIAEPSGIYSGFGTRQEEEMYDQMAFSAMKILSSRTATFLAQASIGNYNPYSKAMAKEDVTLKSTLEYYYLKMVKMEQKKYKKPNLSESLLDMASLIGCDRLRPEGDDLSQAKSID